MVLRTVAMDVTATEVKGPERTIAREPFLDNGTPLITHELQFEQAPLSESALVIQKDEYSVVDEKQKEAGWKQNDCRHQ